MEIGIFILSRGRNRTTIEIYVIRAVKYFLLVDVTLLFCLTEESSDMTELNRVIFAGIILLTYFTGKLQRNQSRSMFTKLAGTGLPIQKMTFNLKAESIIIALSLVLFSVFWFFPNYATNPLSNWFHKSIMDIYDTPIFGFIFKVIGFFFLLSIIFKMVNAFTFLLSGGKISPPGSSNPHSNERNEDDFDEYEDVDDNEESGKHFDRLND